jgi:hypothetical protein
MYDHSKGIPSVTDATLHQSYSKRSTVKKVKFSLHLIKRNAQYMWDSKGEAPRILNPGFKWRKAVSSIPQPLHPQGKKHSRFNSQLYR